MTKIDALKYAEQLQNTSLDLVFLTESLKQVSDLTLRADIEGQDICRLVELVTKEHKRLTGEILKNSYSLSSFIKPDEPTSKTQTAKKTQKIIPINRDDRP